MIEINNLTNFAVDKTFFLGVAKKVLKGENKETENLSIAFIDKKEIHQLNKKYRNKDKPTDVLSFEAGSFPSDMSQVVLCPEVLKVQAESEGISLEKEMANMLIHGILHTLGYDHERSQAEEEKMFKKQAEYLDNL